MSNHFKTYLAMLILVALVLVVFLWRESIRNKSSETQGGLGSDLYQKTENPAQNLPTVNPLKNKPEFNPLSEANPFSGIKTNPFK